ncbi:hypothetical protein [Nonomuraea jabiensis]|uniref:hypothetical protein n=1 Tax=Nonomuraea jabiensis TaxID=882448 RepID=UPI00368ACA22
MSAYQHNWTFEDFLSEILDPKNLAGEKYQDMPEQTARKKLERDWDRIADFVDANPPKGGEAVRRLLDHALSVAMGLPWNGKTGNTDRHILLTILALAYEVGTYTPAFSTRTLAMVANKRQETVAKSLKRLREADHLRLVTPHTYTKSPIYEVTTGTLQTGSLNPLPGLVVSDPLKSVGQVLGHDLFTRGCLGETAARLWTQLDGPQTYTIGEMSRLTGLSENSCRRAVRKLVGVGLASMSDGRPAWFRIEAPYGDDPAFLDQVLSLDADVWEESGPDYSRHVGRGDKRSGFYERQREVRKLKFAHYDRSTNVFVDPFTGEVIEPPAWAA